MDYYKKLKTLNHNWYIKNTMIHSPKDAMEEVQKMGLTNIWHECDSALVLLRLLLELMFHGCFVIDKIFVLIIVRKSGLGLLIFFVKGMSVLIS